MLNRNFRAMPSIFSHAAFANPIGRACMTKPLPLRFWFFSIVCPMIPDADAISFVFRVDRDSIWSHRGITHSIFFATVLGTLVALFGFGKNRPLPTPLLALYFGLATVSHPLLDMLTNGGSGV